MRFERKKAIACALLLAPREKKSIAVFTPDRFVRGKQEKLTPFSCTMSFCNRLLAYRFETKLGSIDGKLGASRFDRRTANCQQLFTREPEATCQGLIERLVISIFQDAVLYVIDDVLYLNYTRNIWQSRLCSTCVAQIRQFDSNQTFRILYYTQTLY